MAPLWNERTVAEAMRSEGRERRADRTERELLRADAAIISVEQRRLPVWLVVRSATDRRPATSAAAMLAVAADRVSSTGEPLFYRMGDTLAYPTPYALLDLSAHAFHPGATAPDVSASGRPRADAGFMEQAAGTRLVAPGGTAARVAAARLATRLAAVTGGAARRAHAVRPVGTAGAAGDRR